MIAGSFRLVKMHTVPGDKKVELQFEAEEADSITVGLTRYPIDLLQCTMRVKAATANDLLLQECYDLQLIRKKDVPRNDG